MPKFISWIPTQEEYIGSFFEICPVSTSDIVYDLGSGDGRLLFAALEKGAACCSDKGVELKVSMAQLDIYLSASAKQEG